MTTNRLAAELRDAPAVLFVCSGNVVRSAFAELYARHRGFPRPVGSAATTYRNPAIFPETVRALELRGVSPSSVRAFRPRHLEDVAAGLAPGTLVLGMTHEHVAACERLGAGRWRCRLLLAALGRDAELADPVMDGADFASTYATIAECIETLRAAPGLPLSRGG